AAIMGVGLLIGLVRSNKLWRLVAALFCLAAVMVAIGLAALYLSPAGNNYARVSPASGFWLLCFAGVLLLAVRLVRLRAGPLLRVGLLVIAGLLVAVLVSSGLWDGVSFVEEYRGRAESFGNEADRHVALALGSLAAAT